MPEPQSPYKRVRRAFSQQKLKQICEMHEDDFADMYDLDTYIVSDRETDNFYLYKDNGANIIAVAHLDTVIAHARRMASFANTASGPIVHSGALDDRLGAYTILELLPKLGIQYDILLTTGEESGRSTAQHFKTNKEYQWMIEFDRGGTDVVMYQYDDAETRDLVKACGAKPSDGIFSDISYMEHLEIKGFNWGVGYRDYHGPRGHAYLEDYWMMIGHYLKFHDANQDIYLPHEPSPYGRYGGYGMGGGSGRAAGAWIDGWKSESSDMPWWDEVDDDAAAKAHALIDDSEWTEEEWDAYASGGLDAVRALSQGAILDDDGDVVSDDFEVVNTGLLRSMN